jgi:hypothetical protein
MFLSASTGGPVAQAINYLSDSSYQNGRRSQQPQASASAYAMTGPHNYPLPAYHTHPNQHQPLPYGPRHDPQVRCSAGGISLQGSIAIQGTGQRQTDELAQKTSHLPQHAVGQQPANFFDPKTATELFSDDTCPRPYEISTAPAFNCPSPNDITAFPMGAGNDSPTNQSQQPTPAVNNGGFLQDLAHQYPDLFQGPVDNGPSSYNFLEQFSAAPTGVPLPPPGDVVLSELPSDVPHTCANAFMEFSTRITLKATARHEDMDRKKAAGQWKLSQVNASNSKVADGNLSLVPASKRKIGDLPDETEHRDKKVKGSPRKRGAPSTPTIGAHQSPKKHQYPDLAGVGDEEWPDSTQTTIEFATHDEAVSDFAERLTHIKQHFKAPLKDDSIPQTQEERSTAVKALLVAMTDTTHAQDQGSKDFNSRWADEAIRKYPANDMEIACWDVVVSRQQLCCQQALTKTGSR